MAEKNTQSQQTTQAQLDAANAQAVAIINQYARPIYQPMTATQVLDGSMLGRTPVFARMSPRMAGLLRKITVRVEVDIKVPAGTTLIPGLFGPAAVVGNVQFTDLNNNKRIDTTGWHLAALAAVKNRQPPGAAFLTDTPLGFGNEYGQGIAMPSVPNALSSDTVVTVEMVYEVPISYGASDLRGVMYVSTTQATAYLQVEINPLLLQPAGPDANADSVYTYGGTGIPTVASIRVSPWQDYLDQIPLTSAGAVILPTQDMGKLYQLINTTQSGITPNTDFRIDFGNLRTYQSQIVRYKNGNAYRTDDIDLFKIEAANMYQFLNIDPKMLSYKTRNALGMDMPPGSYYFDVRNQPVNTTMYGNLAIIMNANSAATGATVETLSEFFSDTLTQGATILGS